MMEAPLTLAEARAYRYGAWAGFPRGNRYREGDCAYEVFPNERGAHHHQCNRKNGHGPSGLYCKQHSKKQSIFWREEK